MSDGYLNTMGMRLLAGRDFTLRDSSDRAERGDRESGVCAPPGVTGQPCGREVPRRGAIGRGVRGHRPGSRLQVLHLARRLSAHRLRSHRANQRSRPFTDFVIRSTPPHGDIVACRQGRRGWNESMISIDLRTLDSTIRDGLVRERLMAALSGVFGTLGALDCGDWPVRRDVVSRAAPHERVWRPDRVGRATRRYRADGPPRGRSTPCHGLAVGSALAFAAASSSSRSCSASAPRSRYGSASQSLLTIDQCSPTFNR